MIRSEKLDWCQLHTHDTTPWTSRMPTRNARARLRVPFHRQELRKLLKQRDGLANYKR